MFTGIVEERGHVTQAETEEGLARFTIRAARVLGGTEVGHSIAVDGVCLTVTRIAGDEFIVEAVPETLKKTTLGQLKSGSEVHLERAARADQPMGGHYVQGHVEGTAKVLSVRREGESLRVRFSAHPPWKRFVVEKGYIAVHGLSLTITDLTGEEFEVVLVPETQRITNLGKKAVGEPVNIEVDVLVKAAISAVGTKLEALEERVRRLEAGE